jgi:predicted dienelactone hydrolase
MWHHRKSLTVLVPAVAVLCGCPAPELEPGFYGCRDVDQIVFRVKDEEVADTSVYETVYFPRINPWVPPSQRPQYPVIMFAPGFNCPPVLYRSYGEQLASWGYVVHFAHYVGLDNVVTTQDISEHLDWLFEENLNRHSVLAGSMDPTRVGVIGHSMGGKYAVMACIEDDRFRAGVALDPVDAAASLGSGSDRFPSITPERMSEVQEPMLFIGTEYPSFLTPVEEDFHQFFLHAESPAQEVRVLNSDHVSFIDDIGPILDFMHLAFGDHEDVDDVTAKNVAIRYIVSWFNVHLKDQTEFQTFLTGPMAQQDILKGRVEIATNY